VTSKGKQHILEQRQPFHSSLIWQLQRRYFAERGVEAWRQGEVPHYVTSNLTIANAYAEIVLALRRDRDRLSPAEQSQEPLTIVELGAGSGRFAFHFLKRLGALCVEAGVAPQTFRYVLTDVADANLDFWRRHPCFEPFFARGLLDLARLDITQPETLALQVSGRTIAPESLRGPLVVIANYVFDSVPQDLFRFRHGQAQPCLVSLTLDEDPGRLDAAETLARLSVDYDYADITEAPYPEPWLRQLLADYARGLHDTHVLVPAAGLRCLDHLAGLSQQGLLLLSADKGEHRLAALDGRAPPGLVRHGSVSLPVNFHAFAQFCAQRGGLALVPERHHNSINVIALLMLPDAAGHAETRRAYQCHVREFGPDAFYSITKHARQTIPLMSAEVILAYLRLSRHDSHQLGRYLPRLRELAGEFDDATRADVVAAIEAVWDTYFPLGEDLDLANGIAALLYAMDEFALALDYFKRSIVTYGRDTGTLCNMAASHHMLGQDAAAAALLRIVLAYEPTNQGAAELAGRLAP
jgi:hypothetical protein